ncbi:hypothetical protein [Alkalilimnicola ehrlichii]|uniref:hypothetical protein n=1 Tax=Alkalilimnicola ehrlichii TaxID=351052 RepID=UPI001C6E8302|nr:hypothetical protein [Alkalilimnicola ehrlichii]
MLLRFLFGLALLLPTSLVTAKETLIDAFLEKDLATFQRALEKGANPDFTSMTRKGSHY